MKANLRHIASNHNHFPISVILPFIPQASRCQVKKIYRDNKSDDQLLIMQSTIEANTQDYDEKMKKLIKYLTAMITSIMDQIKNQNPHQTRRINQRLRILPLSFWLTIGIHHWKVDILQKLVACGISNMKSAHQNSIIGPRFS